MKRFISFSALCLMVFLSVQHLSAQGTTVLVMNDGTRQEGYLRSPFHSTIEYVDLGKSATGKTTRYPIKEIEKIVMVSLEGDTVNYVKDIRYRMFKSNKPDSPVTKGRYKTPVLFREDYRSGSGIALLTEFRQTMETTGMKTAPKTEQWYYVRLKDEPAVRVLGVMTIGENPESTQRNFKRFAVQTFANYPELVQRIENNQYSFRDPLKLVKDYEKIVENR